LFYCPRQAVGADRGSNLTKGCYLVPRARSVSHRQEGDAATLQEVAIMSTAESQIASALALKGDRWLRHANPWSVYTRIPIPAGIALAVWSREWIGWWSLAPVGLVCVWTVLNPTAFPPPASFDHWASRAVLGETFWTKRKTQPIPRAHRIAPTVLIGLNTLGVPVLVWGLVVLDPWMAMTGLMIHMAGKNWFMDRMVWLYDDMTREVGNVAKTTQATVKPAPTG
jgi:hypothetical protein